MQKARGQSDDSRSRRPSSHRLSAHGFRIYFTRHQACFSPFPHGTGSLSVTREYLALEGGPPRFAQDFTCPALLGIPLGVSDLRVPGCHRLWRAFPRRFGSTSDSHVAVPQPQRCKHPWFGLFPVRSPLLGESRLLSFPPGTEMFHFPGYRLPRLFDSARDDPASQGRIAPFGNLRIKARLQLPEAYRSLPRPSSPSRAKASTMRP